MKRIIVLTIICTAALLGCGKKDKEPNREPVSTTSLTESSVVSENTSYIEEEVDGIKIDENIFPDEIFREYVSNKFDKDKNGLLNDTEISGVTVISINGWENSKFQDLKSLKGVELFVNLEELTCYACDLEELDVSNNKELVKLIVGFTNIKKLDISNNTKLVELDCASTNIENLDVSSNKLLENLEIFETNVSKIDLSGLKYLKTFSCKNTLITDLDVTNNNELEGLSIGYTQITNIDLSQNVKLERLDFIGNTNMDELDLSQNISLKSIYCSGSGIKELDLSNNPNVYEVECNKDTIIISDEKIEYLIRY